jgi:hypothetical protein
VALIAALLAYVALLAVPPFVWSRRSLYHPVWRAIEALLCYGIVALAMGAIFSIESGTGWSVLSGIWAGGNAWGIIGSLVVLIGAFVMASIWGSSGAEGKVRAHKSRTRRKAS